MLFSAHGPNQHVREILKHVRCLHTRMSLDTEEQQIYILLIYAPPQIPYHAVCSATKKAWSTRTGPVQL